MDGSKDRNFDELLACFNQSDNPNQSNESAAQSTSPAIPFAQPPAGATPVTGNDAQNFDELMSLFQPAVTQAAPAAAPGLPGNPAAPSPGRPSSIQNAAAVAQRVPPPNRASAPANLTSGADSKFRALQQEHRRRILQQQQAVAVGAVGNPASQQRAAVIAASHVGGKQRVAQPRVPATSAALRQQRAQMNHRVVQPATVAQRMVRQQIPPARSSQTSQPASITDELQAYLTAPTPATQPHPQQRRNSVYQTNPAAPANGASASNRNAMAAQRPAQRPVQGNGRQVGRPPVTQEQVIVGHFCRHALGCLTRLTAGLPNSHELQANLKHNIKRLWGEWVSENITKSTLLESVARFVRQSCPAAANVNVITEFRAWYHHQLDSQRRAQQRQGENPRAATQREVAGRMPTGISNRAPNAVVSAPNPHAMSNAYQYPAARNAPPVAHPGMAIPPGHNIVTAGMVGRHPNPVHGRPGMPQTGKGPARGRAPPKATVQRNQASKTIPGKTIAAKTVSRTPGKLENQIMGTPALAAVQGSSGVPMGGRPKPPPPKPRGKTTTQAKSKDEVALATMASTGARPVAPPPKRPIEGPGTTSMGSAQKKPRPMSKGKQSPSAKKPNGGVAAVVGKERPPPPRTGVQKTGPAGVYMGAGVGVVPPRQGSAPGIVAITGARPPGAPGQAASAPTQRRKGFDDDLNFVTNIVDIDQEQNTLVGETNEMSDVNGGDSSEYSPDMILVGGPLKAKVEAIMRRNGLHEAASKDTMEMISLAARERLSFLLESVSDVARARVEANKHMWETKANGPNMLTVMKQMRDQEDRTLIEQAQQRSKRYKELEEKAAKEAAQKSTDEKSAKDAAAAAEQKRKEKAAAEKRRLADSSQRSALSGAISGIGKKRKRKKLGLAPFKSLSSVNLKSLSNKTSATSGTSVGSLTAKGMTSAGIMGIGAGAEGTNGTVARRPPLTLRDCLAFMSGEPNMRQSTLVYKWHARLGAPRPGQGTVRSTR